MHPGAALALILAAVVGLSMGLLGSGGSILTVPLLVYVAGIPVHEAVATTLVVVSAAGWIGSYLHFRQGCFHLRAALLMGAAGSAGAFFGSALTHWLSRNALMLLFALLMLAVGVAMLWDDTEAVPRERSHPLQSLATGAVIGVLTGFLGVGGGFLLVPAMVLMLRIDAKKAVGASLAVIALNATAGAAGHLRFTKVDWPFTGGLLAVTLAGMWLGTVLIHRISAARLRRIFAYSVSCLGLAIAAVTASQWNA